MSLAHFEPLIHAQIFTNRRKLTELFPLYIKLMLGPLSEDLSRIILAVLGRPGKDFFLLTARPIKKDRASLACSWTRLTIRGSCFEHRGIRTQGSRISFV